MAGPDDLSTTAGSNTALIPDQANPAVVDDAIRTLASYVANRAELTVASAATTNILAAASDKIAISGTTTITSLGTGASRFRFVRFTGALILTHNATSLILPGAANITTAAGDTMVVVSDASSNARVLAYSRATVGPYAPVQQGGGTGQTTNKLYVGWSGSRLKATVDSTDLGNVWTDNDESSGSGWKILPDGTMIQRADTLVTLNVSGDVFVTLPTAFGAATYNVVAWIEQAAATAEQAAFNLTTQTTTQFELRVRPNPGGGAFRRVTYIAIGVAP